VATFVLMFISVGAAQAQATRTWVSGVGDDANPCSRTAPCKTFAGALSKTAAGGEISVLDPGGFGAVTITKSISIVADGAEVRIEDCLIRGFQSTTENTGFGIVLAPTTLSELHIDDSTTERSGAATSTLDQN
jgi:hypothetical protein